MNKFDTSDLNFVNCQWFGLEGVARRTRFIDYWRQNEGPKNQDFYENAHLPEFSSTQDAYAEHDSKSAHQRLCDKYLVLQHSFDSQCIDFAKDTPSDPETRKRDYTALSEGILLKFLISLDYV